ncbi:MAG TPA: hypothetical protein DCS19_10460 [Flavobacterium sp.]|nr:hypothetical protein [Flavobacterium sp.]
MNYLLAYIDWIQYFFSTFIITVIMAIIFWLWTMYKSQAVILKIERLHENGLRKVYDLDSRVTATEKNIADIKDTLNRLIDLNKATFNQVHNGKTADTLYRHLKNNQLVLVIDQLSAISDLYFDELIQLSATYNQLQQTRTSISESFFITEMNKIRSRLINLVADVCKKE